MIQMIAGVFGLQVNGIVKAMDKNCGPLEASPEQEARLIRLGLAVRVDDGTPIGFDEMPPMDDEDDAEDTPELPDGVTVIPEYGMDNTVAELREIGKLCGLTFKVGMTKAEMVAALDAEIEEHMVAGAEFTDDGVKIIDEDDAEDDGEPAPAFDASEAVM